MKISNDHDSGLLTGYCLGLLSGVAFILVLGALLIVR